MLQMSKMEEEDQQPRNAGSSRRWERQGNDYLLEPSKGTQSGRHLDFGPVRHVSVFWPPELYYDKFVLFEGMTFAVTSYSRNRKQICLLAGLSSDIASSWKAFIAPKADPGVSAPIAWCMFLSLLQASSPRSWITVHCDPPLPLFWMPRAEWREEEETRSSFPILLQVTSWETNRNFWETNTSLSVAEYVFIWTPFWKFFSVVSLPTCARNSHSPIWP